MAEPAIARDIGKHDAQIESLQSDVSALKAEIAKANAGIAAINEKLAETRGGWRVLLAVAGTSGALGAGATKLLHSLGFVT